MDAGSYNIPLRGGLEGFALCDADDAALVGLFEWHINHEGYAVSNTNQLLHHLIMGKAPAPLIIDHINNKRLDNRRSNLRYVTDRQNNQNKPKQVNVTSQYIGVSQATGSQHWVVYCGGQYTGTYTTELSAAAAYDEAAAITFGPQCRLNNVTPAASWRLDKTVRARHEVPGVREKNGAWEVSICHRYIGRFGTLDEAEAAAITERSRIANEETEEKINGDAAPLEITRNTDGVAVIVTNRGEHILVDDDKWSLLMMTGKWYLGKLGYPQASQQHHSGAYMTVISMSRFLMGVIAERGIVIDHINRNPSDARMCNLRRATHSLNSHNRTKKPNASSVYLGVHVLPHGWFSANLNQQGTHFFVGNFKEEKVAAFAYNCRANELYGEEANLNNVDPPDGWVWKEHALWFQDETGVLVKPHAPPRLSLIHI